MSKAFDKWWKDEGSTRPEQGDDVETHTMKKCRIAWDNGAYVNEVERDALQARIKQLEAELEEERQENASLRSGDDYERGAE